MAIIELTNSSLVAIVDDWWYIDLLALGPWRLSGRGYVEMTGDARLGHCWMHKLVLEINGYDLAGLQGDHRDRNRLDNRLRNLRTATRRQNQMNRGLQSNNTSGYLGVFWAKAARKWRAIICVNGRRKYLGLFTDKVEAARAYDAALLAGPDAEFGVFNFPPLS